VEECVRIISANLAECLTVFERAVSWKTLPNA